MFKLVEKVKKKNRIAGAIYEWSKGKVYIAWKSSSDVYTKDEKSNSQAVRAGKACWALDEEILLRMRRHGIRIVGVFDRDSLVYYFSTVEKFREVGATLIKGGAMLKALPIGSENFNIIAALKPPPGVPKR